MEDSLWDDHNLTSTSARSKRPEPSNEAPTQQPMRAGIKPAQQKAPSSDQKRTRRQMAKNASQPEGVGDHEAKPEWETAQSFDLCDICGWPVSKSKDGGWTHDAKNPVQWTDRRKAASERADKTSSTTSSTKESTTMQHETEADLLAKMAGATTLAEQSHYSALLDDLRNARRDQIAASASIDFDAIGEAHAADPLGDYRHQMLVPMTASLGISATASSGEWWEDLVPSSHSEQDISASMRAEASLWYEGLWDAVKEDRQEFSVQARNAARRSGSHFGAQAPGAASVFLSTVSHLHRKATHEHVAFDETQKPPYGVPSGSSLPTGVENEDTFDGIVNGEQSNPEDQKTTKDMGEQQSLSEGGTPAGDTSTSIENPVHSTEDNTADKSQGTGYTDPLTSGGTGASRRSTAEVDPAKDAGLGVGHIWTNTSCPAYKTLKGKDCTCGNKSSAYRTATEDPKSTGFDTGKAPSLTEGDTPAGDHAQSPVKEPEPAQDKSTWGGDPDSLDTGGQDGSSAAQSGQGAYTSMRALASDIAASTSGVAVTFAQGLGRCSSLEDTVGGISGREMASYLLSHVSAQHRATLERVLAGENPFAEGGDSEGGKTCSVCGDKIAHDPNGEDPSTWHHDNGEKHDHEAKPGGKGKESRRRTAGEYQGGSPKEGDTAECHKDGGKIQFFSGEWMHLKGTGDSHNDVHPATPKEKADKDKKSSSRRMASIECPDCGGTGAVPMSGGEPEEDVDEGYVQCSTCKGKGTISGKESTRRQAGEVPESFKQNWDKDKGSGSGKDEDEDSGKPWLNEDGTKKDSTRHQATVYCPKHKVYVGDGNREQHDHCPTERRQKKDARTAAAGRPLYEIASEVRRDWSNVYFGAVPYLDAMGQLSSMTDSFYDDDAATVVAYFLSNTTTWRGDTARRIKAELREMQSAHRSARHARLRTAGILITNVGIVDKDDLVCKGKDPSGKEVKFKVTKKEMDDLRSIMLSDLWMNLSGVTVEESDIIKDDAKESSLQVSAAFAQRVQANLGGRAAADYSTDKAPGRWVGEVAGVGDQVWSRNSITYDSREEAERYLKDLSGRWFGFDLGRVRQIPEGGLPPSNTESVDMSDPDIVVNYR